MSRVAAQQPGQQNQGVSPQMFARPRSWRRHQDRTLVPVAVGRLLEVKVTYLAAQMREVGVTRRLVLREVQCWLAHPEQAPQWFGPALAKAHAAQREATRHEVTQPARARPRVEHRSPRQGSDSGSDSSLSQSPGRDVHLEEFLAELRAVPVGSATRRRR